MPVQLGLLDDIVVIEPPPEVPTAAKTAIDLKMLGCYQMRPGYEAMDFMVTGESLETGCIQGYVNGRSKMRWKALAQPQLAFEFDFKKVLESHAEPQSHRLDFVAAVLLRPRGHRHGRPRGLAVHERVLGHGLGEGRGQGLQRRVGRGPCGVHTRVHVIGRMTFLPPRRRRGRARLSDVGPCRGTRGGWDLQPEGYSIGVVAGLDRDRVLDGNVLRH